MNNVDCSYSFLYIPTSIKEAPLHVVASLTPVVSVLASLYFSMKEPRLDRESLVTNKEELYNRKFFLKGIYGQGLLIQSIAFTALLFLFPPTIASFAANPYPIFLSILTISGCAGSFLQNFFDSSLYASFKKNPEEFIQKEQDQTFREHCQSLYEKNKDTLFIKS